MKGKICLKAIELDVCLGVEEKEQAKPQKVFINIELTTDVTKAIETDSITEAIDYSKLLNKLKAALANKSFHLIETLASQVLDIVANFDPRIETATVLVSKKAPETLDLPMAYAQVELHYKR